MPPIDHPCPQCGAHSGRRCRDYLGKPCAPHSGRGKTQTLVPGNSSTPCLFDCLENKAAGVPAEAVSCAWCGDPCPPGRTTRDDFCQRTGERATRPPSVFPGDQSIPWEDEP